MKKNTLCTLAIIVAAVAVFSSCSSGISALPEKPVSVEQVKKSITGKKYNTIKTGFYGNLAVNDKTEAEWIDIKTEKEKTNRESAEAELKFSVHFVNDSAATVVTRDSTYAARYAVDSKVDEYDSVKEGIKIRLTYKDPSFSFGGAASDVTYTFVVKGLDDKRLLLQLPRTVNRKPLISMLEAQ